MFQKLSVNIKIRGRGAGSGCLFQSSESHYTFVITAKHCILGNEKIQPSVQDIIIQRDIDLGTENFLIVDSYYIYPNDDHDFAIILVQRITDVPSITIGTPKRNSEVVFYGYPNIFAEDEYMGSPQNAKITMLHNKNKFDMRTETSLYTFTSEAIDNSIGFSGSGVYYEFENHIVLTGIVTKLRNTDGVFNLVTAESAVTISNYIESILSCKLVPYLLSSFDFYVKSTFEKYGASADVIFNQFYSTGIQELTPFLIFENLKGNLFIPPLTGELHNINLQENVLWSGWSKILTFMHISTQEIINLENSIKYLYLGQEIAVAKEETLSNTPLIRLLYSFQLKTISDCIKHIFLNEDTYKTINLNDNVVINSPESFTTKVVTKEQIKGILANIDDAQLLKRRININDPNIYKNINVFHIEAFDSKLEGIEFCPVADLEKKIQSSINEVLRNDYN